MKKIVKTMAFAVVAATLASCGTTGSGILGGTFGQGTDTTTGATTSNTSGSTATGVLGSILGSILGGSTALTQADLVGTWSYTGSDCVFESENLLMKAGGEVAAKKIESELDSKLAGIGVKKGSCSFTFKNDKTFSAIVGGKTINGTYTYDEKNKKITLKTLLGLGSMSAHVARSGSGISLLFESDKLLTLAQTVGGLTNSTTLKTVSALLGKYDGMMVGLKLSK